MKEILNCYTNWRIDVIMLLAILALILVSGESETFLVKVFGCIIAVVDFFIARRWHCKGRLSELDSIAE